MSVPYKDIPHIAEFYISREPTAEERVVLDGIARGFGWRVAVRPLFPEAMPPDTLFGVEPQARLDTSLEEIRLKLGKGAVKNAFGAMKKNGLGTVREALAVGATNIEEIRNIGKETVPKVAAVLKEHFPEVPLPSDVDPAVIASYCPTLRHVTWRVLHDYTRTLFYNGMPPEPSVQDIITTPYRDLSFLERLPQSPTYRDELRADALAFAEPYYRAQQAYPGAEPPTSM